MKKFSNKIRTFLPIILCALLALNVNALEIKKNIILPKAKREKYEEIVHGKVLVDNYRWLRDENWPEVKNKEILGYIKEENDYTERYFSQYKEQEEKLYKEMKQRVMEEEEGYPKKIDNYYYYRKYSGNYFALFRKKDSLKGREEKILDVNKLAEGKTKGYKVDAIYPSPKHDKIIYTEDLIGGEKYSISVKNLKTGEVDSNVVNDMWGNIIWHGNNKGFFYSKRDNKSRVTEVYYHELGRNQFEDIIIYKKKDEGFSIDIMVTSDNKYLIINPSNNTENEIRILNIENDLVLSPSLLLNREKGLSYYIDHGHDTFYLKINDKGKNFRLVKLKEYEFNNKEKWIEIISHSDSQFLENFSVSKGYLVVNVRVNGVNKIVVFDKSGKSEEVKFDEETYNAYGFFTTYDTDLVRINYSSFITPQTVYDYDCKIGKLYIRKTQRLKGGYCKDKYQTEKIYITADDGVKIPVSLFYKKDRFKMDGTNPLLLYGYGAYGISSFANFDPNIFSLVDRGFVYAIAHIRGGSEQGYKWYEDAKLLTKKRTFYDYINCAEGLVKRKYGSKDKIVGYGASAGGMIIGYVINERPELLKVAVAEVPSVDTLNTMLDKSLKNTPFHYTELGNPEINEYYEYIKSYSAYDNIKKQKYPALYVIGGISDLRIAYWEPTKWVAKLRYYNKGTNPILLHINTENGHFGFSGKNYYLNQQARMYNFILINLNTSTH